MVFLLPAIPAHDADSLAMLQVRAVSLGPGEPVQLWREHLELSQDELARRSGLVFGVVVLDASKGPPVAFFWKTTCVLPCKIGSLH